MVMTAGLPTLQAYSSALKRCAIVVCSHYKMINGSSNVVVNCYECDDMKQLFGGDLYSGLLAKLVFLATLAVLTTLVNAFLMYIVCLTKSLVANTKVFFISLCVAHLLGSTAVIPFWIFTRLSPEIAENSPLVCQVASFFWILMILASFYSLSALSLDRYLIICNPLRYPVTASTSKKVFAVSFLWIICIIFASAPNVGWAEYTFHLHSIPVCGLNMKYSLSFTVVLIVLGFGIPLIIDIFCCVQIISIAQSQSRAIGSRKDSGYSTRSYSSSSSTTKIQPGYKMSKLKQKLNSLRLIFAGTGSFLICWLPYLGVQLWMASSSRGCSNIQESMAYILEFVVMCIALLNGLLNPIIIMLSNRDYREEIRRLFVRTFRLTNVDDIIDIDTSSTQISRRSQFHHSNISDACHKTQDDVHLTNRHENAAYLKKQENEETSQEHYPDLFWPTTKLLDLNRLQPSVTGNIHESSRLVSHTSQTSVDFDSNLECILVECHTCTSTDIHTNLIQKITKIDIELSNVVIK